MKSGSGKLKNLKKTHKSHVDSLSQRIQALEKYYAVSRDSLSEMKDSIRIYQELIMKKKRKQIKRRKPASNRVDGSTRIN